MEFYSYDVVSFQMSINHSWDEFGYYRYGYTYDDEYLSNIIDRSHPWVIYKTTYSMIKSTRYNFWYGKTDWKDRRRI